MRKHVWMSILTLLVAGGALSVPASAQQDDEATRTTQSRDEEDNGEWGLLGLLGLAGLAGLKRREHDHVTHGHASTR